MKTAKKYRHKGESLTLSEWAARLGTNYNVLQMRIANGWPIEKVLSAPVKVKGKRKPKKLKRRKGVIYRYRGKAMTAPEWAKELGIKEEAFIARLRRTKNPREIFHPGIVCRKNPGQRFTYDGVTLDLEGWAGFLGVSRDLLYKRLREGRPPEEMFAPQGKRKRGRPPKNRPLPEPPKPPEEQKLEGPLVKAVTSGKAAEGARVPEMPVPKKHNVSSPDFLRGMAEGIWLTISAVAMMMAESGGEVAGKNLKRLEDMFKGGFAERFASVVAKDQVK